MFAFNRLLYLAYYFRKMNWSLLRRFMAYTRASDGVGYLRQAAAFVGDSLRYNISPLEYYQFGFPGLSANEKGTWAGTGTMYEFQREANPPATRSVLADKRAFYAAYRQFFRHELWSLDQLKRQPEIVDQVLCTNERLVFKDSAGNCGASVRIVDAASLEPAQFLSFMTDNGFDMVEAYVTQHHDLQRLSPSGVNTVRIFTLLDERGDVHILGGRLRISVDSPVDNLAAGNLAAPIDEATGAIDGPGVYSDITRPPESIHPATGEPIEGFHVPFWQETLALALDAARLHPENRSIGWDIVVTPDGPGLIEGNHDWCKLVWQLPVQRGLKHLLPGS